jgi:DNA (cytosine-5)-methyltransferase 1
MTPAAPPQFKVVDLFAGGGGASLGIEQALGVAPIVAVNHCPAAIAMHAANHPRTIHLTEDVFNVSPWSVVAGGKGLDLLWASPSCTHFSRARGGKPVREQLRTLGWVVVEWARAVAPRVICVENVAEMLTWGPLNADGTPIAARKGETFREWVKALELAGYRVEWRILGAADYGAPTIRKRLFVVARRDRQPIVWPEPTHGPGLQPYRTAAECIDWSVPCPSIFARKKPLAAATLRRVVEGIRRYVLGGKPFLVNLTHGGRVEGIDEPARTITGAHRGEKAVAGAHLLNLSHGGRSESLDEPARTLTATPKGGDRMLVAPILTRAHGHGWDRDGGPPTPADALLPTVTATDEHALVASHLVKLYGRSSVADLTDPTPTVTGTDKLGLAGVFLDKMRGSARAGQPVSQPAPTATAGGEHQALVAASLVRHNGTTPGHGNAGRGMSEPLGTLVAADTHALLATTLAPCLISTANGEARGQAPRVRPVTEPKTTTVATGSQGALVAGHLVAYYGSETDGQALDHPMRTVPTKDRFGHVECDLRAQLAPAQLATALEVGRLLAAHGLAVGADGLVTLTLDGALYVMVDIGLRMLTPRELARAQGFPDSYVLTGTRSDQIARIGNSVCPPVVKALLRSLFADDLQGRPSLTRARPRVDTRARPRTPARATPTAPLFAGSNAAK